MSHRSQRKSETRFMPDVARAMYKIPVFLIVPIAYIVLGVMFRLWHPAWLLFFVIPIYYVSAAAFNARDERGFFLKLPVPIVITVIFLIMGFSFGVWHPAWMMFLIIPVYYWAAARIKRG